MLRLHVTCPLQRLLGTLRKKNVKAVTLTFGSQVKALPSFMSFMWVYEKFYFCQSPNQYAANDFISAFDYVSFDVPCPNKDLIEMSL